jgi:glutamate synthase (NADPH/NADH) large chain
MSGGVAYVLDETGDFEKRCNLTMVALEPVQAELAELDSTDDLPSSHGRVHFNHLNKADEQALREQIEKHLLHTNSERARLILENWADYLPKFTKVMPTDYRRALQEQSAQAKQGEAA